MVVALASCDETLMHLDMLYHTQSLPQEEYQDLSTNYTVLSKRLNRFLQAII